MEFDDFDNNTGYTTNLDKVVCDSRYLTVVRETAARLIEQPYHTLGNWLKNLSDPDLTELLEIVESQGDLDEIGDTGVADGYDNILLLALMMSQAEGVDVDDFDTVSEITTIMSVLLVTEGLARKGFVEITYENLSFGKEVRDAVVAKKTGLFDDYLEGDDQ